MIFLFVEQKEMIWLLPRDLQHVIADKLDEISLLNLSRSMPLRITQNYWKGRVAKLSYVERLRDWKVTDWGKTLADITYLYDYHSLTYVVAALQDFLTRGFSVTFLSEVHTLFSHGYFSLLEELKNFLRPQEDNVYYQHGGGCLCQFHYRLDIQKELIRIYIQRYKSKDYFVHYTEGWLTFSKYINTNNFYYQIAADSFNYSSSKFISIVDAKNDKYRITYI